MTENQEISPETPSKAPLSIRRFLPIGFILAGLVVFMSMGGHQYLTYEQISAHREEIITWYEMNMVLAVFSYIAIYILITAFSIPGAVWVTLAGGLVFGFLQGVIYVVIAATIGAVLIFLAARYACFDYFHAKAGPMMHRMEDGFKKNALSYLLFLRLVPVFPFWLVNLVPALLGVPLKTFAMATFFGIIPGTAVFTWIGSGLGEVLDRGEMPDLQIIFEPVILFPMLGLGFLSITPIIYKRFKAS